MNYKLAIFDWDGTLMDSVPRIVYAMQTAASEVTLNIPTTEQVKDIIGLSMNEAFDVLFGEHQRCRLTELSERYSFHYLSDAAPKADMFDGFSDLLHILADKDIALAVATGKTRRGLDRVLQQSNTQTLFQATRCASEASSKPSPDMLLQLLTQLNIAPSEAVMIGDSIHDLNMANNANIAGIGITHGAHSYERLKTAKPVAIVDNFEQLLSVFCQTHNGT